MYNSCQDTAHPAWFRDRGTSIQAHQRNRAVLLLVVKEERTVRKPADKVIAPVLLDKPVLSHVDIIPKTRLLYQFYCINKL